MSAPPAPLPTTVLKLGTAVTDLATKTKGMLLHMQVEWGGSIFYNFQPRSLRKDDGMPVECHWIVNARISDGVHVPTPDIPVAVLGTEVVDIATGFKGIAIAFTLHLNGCLHVSVQPQRKGENGERVKSADFDLRRMTGKYLPKMTEAEIEQADKRKPGPAPYARFSPTKPTTVTRH